MISTLLFALLSCSLTFGNPLSDFGGEQLNFPYKSCNTYQLGGRSGFSMTENSPLKNGSELAFYPLTHDETMLYLNIMFQDAHFKVKVEGSMVSLQKCNPSGSNCLEEELEGVKHSDYIRSHEWNLVYVRLNSNQLSIHVGPRKVKSILLGYRNFNNAYWAVRTSDIHQKEYNPYEPEYLYLVQFKCKGYWQWGWY